MRVQAEMRFDNDAQWRMTDGALDSFEKRVVGTPLTVNFDPSRMVGGVISAKRREDLEVIDLEVEIPDDLAPFELAPGGVVVKREDDRIVDFDPLEVSVVCA